MTELSALASRRTHLHNIDHTADSATEAARYALVRRLVPVLRHHMVVYLQPITMIYEVVDRKFGSDPPDMKAVRDGMTKIANMAHEAVKSCLDVVQWLAPDPRAVTTVKHGIQDCVDIVASNFKFRGLHIRNESGEVAMQVSQGALREVVTAAMLAITDGVLEPVELVIRAQLTTSREVLISLLLRPGEASGYPEEIAYRPLVMGDVEALARQHAVEFSHDGSHMRMGFAASGVAG